MVQLDAEYLSGWNELKLFGDCKTLCKKGLDKISNLFVPLTMTTNIPHPSRTIAKIQEGHTLYVHREFFRFLLLNNV